MSDLAQLRRDLADAEASREALQGRVEDLRAGLAAAGSVALTDVLERLAGISAPGPDLPEWRVAFRTMRHAYPVLEG